MQLIRFGKAALGAAVVGVALGAVAQPASEPMGAAKSAGADAAAALSSADRAFVEKAAMGGMVEVELGNLAQQKAASDGVRQFGTRMVQDHTKANDELKQIAASKNLQVPGALDKQHQKDVDRFSKMTGSQFDKAYMSHMVEDHKHVAAEFKKEASSGKDADVKGFASKTLPTIEEHLNLAQSTYDGVKKAK